MDVKLAHVLASETAGLWESHDDPLIDDVSRVGIPELPQACLSRRRQAPGELAGNIHRMWPAHPNNAYSGHASARRNREDRLCFVTHRKSKAILGATLIPL